jgi:AMMECR1 domain-containing protein
VDGIYIKKGGLSGCFLPQVATETGWSKEQFLSYCCAHKASLPPDSWKDPDTEVYLFTADVFGSDFKDI